MGVIDSLLPSMNAILGVRDSVGAVIQPVYIVTRTWYTDGTLATPAVRAQEGVPKDTEVQLLPSPGIKNLSQSIALKAAGSAAEGDIILTNVSKQTYTESDLNGSSGSANVEKFFRVGAKIYQVIDVTEKYVTWDVQVRELTNQTRYP